MSQNNETIESIRKSRNRLSLTFGACAGAAAIGSTATIILMPDHLDTQIIVGGGLAAISLALATLTTIFYRSETQRINKLKEEPTPPDP